MTTFKKYYDAIDDIASHLKVSLIGPVQENEIIESESPLSRYSIGVLWGQQKSGGGEQSGPENNEELFEDEKQNDDGVINQSVFKPSSMGISFSAVPGDELEVVFSYAVYHRTFDESGTEETRFECTYKREAKQFSSNTTVPGRVCNVRLISDNNYSDVSVMMNVRRINKDGSVLATISVLNNNVDSSKKDESCASALFQCELSLKSKNCFIPIYSQRGHRSAEEEKNEMLYDSVRNYSYGHGCSTIHTEEHGIIKEIKSSFIPFYRMKQMMPGLLDNCGYLYMSYWKNADRKTACVQLDGFIDQYRNWYQELQKNDQITNRYSDSSEITFSNIEKCITRLKNGVQTLGNNDNAWRSFLYMNEAMLLQRIKTKHCSEETVCWYPFQLAYILQIIPDIAEENSTFRDNVDLLWFPTGGGKTEAYLGLSAFSIFYRRLSGKGEDINGVAVLMRYTLRLLTIQQFQRASALICACEYMRKKYHIPGDEISIGLWIGSGMTPNHTKDAEETLQKIREINSVPQYEANPMQITSCPWCGAEIGIGGYFVQDGMMNISCCNNPGCEFSGHLPIYVIDEDIYKIAPTFVLSTVDKFARITWEEKSGSLLGENGCKPPELIIQDELHLISGPLGSLAGIYEMAVEHICRHYGRSPKIIASTATVKNADEQIKTIYDRNMIQFPPNGLSYDDSFFSVQASEEKRSARTYIGICSIGSGTSEMLIKIFGVLTYMKYLYKKQGLDTNVIDQFYTYVGYFNSLKELGSNSIIVSDRILSEVKYLVTYKFGEEAQKAGLSVKDIPPFMKNNELTSRNGSAEIKRILDRLDVRCTSEDCYDYIMASNMLSVGIDIDRLGVMCVYGQPKSNSEYIQATSRVGRSNPGLVITIYNNMRSRDKSFFEQFIYYHKTFYKYVEATSVTSYSPRAIEKALHSAMMAIIRHTISKYNPNEGASRFDRDDKKIQNIKEQIIKRVNDIEPWQAEYAEEWLDYYLDCWKELCDSIPDRLVFSDYHDEDKALLRSGENQNGSDIPTVLNSVRNVESSVSIYFTKR